ncbi:unnamed protein product, partial [Closterium sp. Naga37s-1]
LGSASSAGGVPSVAQTAALERSVAGRSTAVPSLLRRHGHPAPPQCTGWNARGVSADGRRARMVATW